VRSSPTPSACAAAAACVPGGARAAVAGQRSRRLVGRGDPDGGLLRVGVDGDRAALAVDQHDHPLGDVGEPTHADHAGQAELAGDDRGVAGRAPQPGGQRDDPGRVQAGGVGRGEVVGEQHRGRLGRRDAGLPLPGQLGDDPVAHVPHVGRPLRHDPAEAGEQLDELLRRPDGGDLGRGTLTDPLLDGGQQPPVPGQLRRGGEDLGADAGRRSGAGGQPLRDRVGRCGEPVLLDGAPLLGDRQAGGRRQLDGTDRADDGADRHPGYHRRAGQHGRSGEGLRGGPRTGRGAGHGGPHCLLGPVGEPVVGRVLPVGGDGWRGRSGIGALR
jgi:hypothetical protein